MSTAVQDDSHAKAGRYFAPWETDELPPPPAFGLRYWTALIGPGLLLAGSNIGGGEWLLGPVVTAQYGGQIMWLAAVSIGLQIFYNLCVMRYTLYTGEPIFVGFFRTAPGPKFWVVFYLMIDLGGIFPYLAANAAVPLAAVILGRLPEAGDDALVRNLSYIIFFSALVPLVFGGKIYNAVEKVLVTKIVLVLSYLLVICLFMVSWETWVEIFSGFLRFGSIPQGLPDPETGQPRPVDWATLAAFAAIAGAGGLSNMNFSNYTRDKGWGMGARVGAIPSMVGGKKVRLSHVGKIFPLAGENLTRWRGWLRHILRDQTAVWAVGCVLGMALPAMLSLEFIPGVTVGGHAAAAMTAEGMAARHGQIFWYTTLLCGFIVLAPPLVSDIDGITRRWTDVIWTGARRFRHLEGHKVKYIYYGILSVYSIWGMIALRLTPDPLVLAIVTGTLRNIGLGATSLHTLYINRNLLPPELRPPWHMQLGLVVCFVFFLGISIIAFHQRWTSLMGGA